MHLSVCSNCKCIWYKVYAYIHTYSAYIHTYIQRNKQYYINTYIHTYIHTILYNSHDTPTSNRTMDLLSIMHACIHTYIHYIQSLFFGPEHCCRKPSTLFTTSPLTLTRRGWSIFRLSERSSCVDRILLSATSSSRLFSPFGQR